MDERELNEKLSGIELKEVELHRHRSQLRQALMRFAETQNIKQPSWLKWRIEAFTQGVRRAIITPKPAWQMFLTGVLSTVFVLGCSVGIPSATKTPGTTSPITSSRPAPFWITLDQAAFQENFSFIRLNTRGASITISGVSFGDVNGGLDYSMIDPGTEISISVQAKKAVDLRVAYRLLGTKEIFTISRVTADGVYGGYYVISGDFPYRARPEGQPHDIIIRHVDTGSVVKIDTGFKPDAGVYALECYVGDSCVAVLPFWVPGLEIPAAVFGLTGP